MKIKRFENINENVDTSFLSAPWTEEKFLNIHDMKSKIEGEEENLLSLLTEYLIMNPELQEQICDLSEDETRATSYLFDPRSTVVLTIYYCPDDDSYGDDFIATLNKVEFQEFLKFLKNPEMYRSSKKYNI